MAEPIVLRPVIKNVLEEILDRNRAAAGIRACEQRQEDFSNRTEMELAGVAMIPEARQLMADAITRFWAMQKFQLTAAVADYRQREIVIGAGFHAAVYCANRVLAGFPRPIVLEKSSAERAGGAFAVSLNPVFRLNSRSRPGGVGFPDQDRALNYLPGALLQPAMLSSEEYPSNADMAWLIRLTLAQYAEVYPGVTVTSIHPDPEGDNRMIASTSAGTITTGRVIDARGMGADAGTEQSDGGRILTFTQLMNRMGDIMFPLRGMKQVAVIGAGDSGKCAVESLLGIAPGHTSPIGLDYVERVDWYTNGQISQSCSDFREGQRGRYIRIAQFLEGNVSNPLPRLRVMGAAGGYASPPSPDGVLVNDRNYDVAVLCTGMTRQVISSDLTYFAIRVRGSDLATALGLQAKPLESFRIGPAADLPFSTAEQDSGITEIPANRVAMFRLAPRTAALASMLGGVTN